ncbi:alpha/beta hydrolase [Acidovorax sp. SRB_14]|uniref:patatin-like phospholipase family protein n=1 Tax=unclassified Acidovorax TaxID=2684926 RepID=UPI00145E2AF9|nr:MULTISPECIES: patatin-like phospholipase family protein [unclassified Acidovorax]NMM76704.1 alpha/beta hydrolase [Acidovorax sp. SRB_24]NMM81630.1 alpha/beta hydrolase [Acidovorax sp. SRB_14]NMM88108.1 alpha/beta hydrolase [Rhodococcus sp. SRB_17]
MESTAQGKTAFVFAGGGSFGAIQVGMLHALVAHGVQPDLVVGASVGAINGAYFAGDPTLAGVERLEALWCNLKRSTLFPMTFSRLAGLFSRSPALVDASGLQALIAQHLPYSRLEQAALPMHVVATEQLHGHSVCLSSGPAVEAILASCAIPAIFPPVRVGKDYLIDGAIAGNTPVMAAVALGATRLVVLPTGYACALSAPPASAIASALHALNMLIAHQLVQDLELLADRFEVLTVPPLCPLAASAYDFSRAHELIERAKKNTRRWLEGGGLQRPGVPGALRPHVD